MGRRGSHRAHTGNVKLVHMNLTRFAIDKLVGFLGFARMGRKLSSIKPTVHGKF